MSFLFACGSKKEPPPTTGSAEPPKGSATEPPKGSAAEPPKGSAAEPPKGSADPGSGSAVADGSGSAVGSGSAAEPPAKVEFDKLTHDQKMDFMKKQVVPTMKPLFQKFDAKEFANFGCKTCHGKEPAKVKYKMPNPELEKLDWAALKDGKQHPETAKWMADVVKPEMAKLLGEEEMSQTNPKGFGCTHCHQEKK